MIEKIVLYDVLLLGVVFLCSIPLSRYIVKVFRGDKNILSRILAPIEKSVYKLFRINENDQMNAKQYAIAVIVVAVIGFLLAFIIQIAQGVLPLNPNHVGGVSIDTAFNSSLSYVTNTNWQGYTGETMMSYGTQMLVFTVQNFVSAATGIAILFVLIRGFIQKETKHIGNYFVDMTHIILYILLPISILMCLVLVSQGVVQTLQPDMQITSLSGLSDIMPFGPAASQVAIKQLGSNGGGFFGANGAFPFENPSAIANFIEMAAILILPLSLVHFFGSAIKDKKQGKSMVVVMSIIFIIVLIVITYGEFVSGSLEGKEIRLGDTSSLWGTITTAVSNGSSNAALDSFSSIALFGMLFLMQIGEVVFGGVGSGIYGMIAFVILTIFMAGLMVGRTPEFLRKKIGAYEMKMVCIMILLPPILILGASALTMVIGQAGLLQSQGGWLGNTGAHGFTEILYSFTSLAANNGSSLNGIDITQPYFQILGGIIMFVARFVPIVATIYLASNLSTKKEVPVNEGSLTTTTPLFNGFLLLIIVIIGALTFLPALALGPIAGFLG